MCQVLYTTLSKGNTSEGRGDNYGPRACESYVRSATTKFCWAEQFVDKFTIIYLVETYQEVLITVSCVCCGFKCLEGPTTCSGYRQSWPLKFATLRYTLLKADSQVRCSRGIKYLKLNSCLTHLHSGILPVNTHVIISQVAHPRRLFDSLSLHDLRLCSKADRDVFQM